MTDPDKPKEWWEKRGKAKEPFEKAAKGIEQEGKDQAERDRSTASKSPQYSKPQPILTPDGKSRRAVDRKFFNQQRAEEKKQADYINKRLEEGRKAADKIKDRMKSRDDVKSKDRGDDDRDR